MGVGAIVRATSLDAVDKRVQKAFDVGVDRVEIAVDPSILGEVVSYFTNEGKYDVSSRAAVGCEGRECFANSLDTNFYLELRPRAGGSD